MVPFVHLHVHTQYSLLDGQSSIDRLVDKASAEGMPAIAITDHGSMYGVKEFYNYVTKKNKGTKAKIAELQSALEGATGEAREEVSRQMAMHERLLVKPLLGCECYVARESRHIKKGKEHQSGYHLVVIAKNLNGYKNLIKMVSLSWTEGFYSRPRIDRELLDLYGDDLIISSACIAGEVPRNILNGNLEAAEEALQWYKNRFGEDYYLELQRHPATTPSANKEVYVLQVQVNKVLIELARKYDVKLIATNDVHFVEEEDAEAHDRLICLATNKCVDDLNRLHYSQQEWMKSTEEMNRLFADIPEALSNTLEIADKVEYYSIDSGPMMPDFPIPEGYQDDDDYLRYLTYVGADKKYGADLTAEIRQRIDFELDTIKRMKFPGYFLIVQDFIAAAREMGVAVGPGRGSAAGSAVAYCLGITDIDPVKYDLLFERFLNPDRISMPDIDIDFDDDGRGEVLRWVTEKYGKNRVAHIITYGTMATKSAIKDVARVQRLSLAEANRLAKLVPDKIPGQKKVTLRAACDFVPELNQAAQSPDPLLRDTLKYAQMLEGNVRNTGVHACGIIIGKEDINTVVPVSVVKGKTPGEDLLVTQYEGRVIEETGLIKMDFLGLKTLSIIKEAIENIKLMRGIDVDISAIPLDDRATYELYSAGRTTGTFQFESSGMQKYLRELQPTKFEDLIAMNALYRPGPMEYIPDFVERKHGRSPIVYDLPEMERYLSDTYGITVYQEQVMLLSRLLAGFTRGESDELRKAMGKKLIEKMMHLKAKFMKGAQDNGHPLKTLEKIWADWEKFAQYAFNKSHATCYSWVAYQTAYLKANYPAEYMAAVLSRNIDNLEDLTKFMDECKTMGIKVLGPDINESLLKFSVNSEGNIRFGLKGVKGVGEGAVINIVEERRRNGVYTSIFDFISRVNLAACNKRVIESLVLSGSFDAFTAMEREQYVAVNSKGDLFLDVLIRYGQKVQQDKLMSANTLFGDSNSVEISTPEIPALHRWSTIERLNKERDLVGLYLSAHPLDPYYVLFKDLVSHTLKEYAANEVIPNAPITIGGIVTGYREGFTSGGKPYCVIKLEDYSGSVELAFFDKNFINYSRFGKVGLSLWIRCSLQPRKRKPQELGLVVGSIDLIEEVKDHLIRSVTIKTSASAVTSEFVDALDKYVASHPGNTELRIKLRHPVSGQVVDLVSRSRRVEVNRSFIIFLEDYKDVIYSIN